MAIPGNESGQPSVKSDDNGVAAWRGSRAALAILATLGAPQFLVAQSSPVLGGGAGASTIPTVLAVAGLLAAAVGVVLAVRAQRLAGQALLEAGQARTRAQAGTGGLAPEALAAAERVWSARIGAIEAQLASGPARNVGLRPADRPAPTGDVNGRIEELERKVAGLNVSLKELRRAPVGRSASVNAAPEESTSWPALLAADANGLAEVRQALSEAIKTGEPAARDFVEKLQQWEKKIAGKPSAADLSAALTELSAALLAALRRGAGVTPLDAAQLSNRVLGALRASWKSSQPQVDSRIFLPGTTFDPDWMEDHTRAGMHRPVISEMLSWAVFEKLDSGLRVLAKARVTTD